MKKEVVIIGGGFAGINLAIQLTNKPDIHVTLVDKNNYNFFPPLLYQVATGFLDVSNISYPFRKLFHKRKNVNFRLAELIKINREENQVVLSNGTLPYDYLVIATGTESNYFGMENIRKHAYPMKTVDDAINMRNELLLTTEQAAISQDPEERALLGTIVIAGGGPTGVEVAGMLAEMRMNILYKDYPEFSGKNIRIVLVDGAPTVLSPMSEKSQKYTHEALVKMGVEVRLNAQVKDYVDNTVIFSEGEPVKTKLLLWTAGVTSMVFDGIPKESYGRGRRLMVNEFNLVEGFSNIYAIGDTAIMTGDPGFPQGHPQLAQPAIQQGKNLAKNILAMQQNKPLKGFEYNDRGSMAIIGRSKAVAELPKPKMFFKGWIAWAMWLAIHLFSLIHYRNRIKTMYNWTTAYFTKDQSLRMIIRPNAEKK